MGVCICQDILEVFFFFDQQQRYNFVNATMVVRFDPPHQRAVRSAVIGAGGGTGPATGMILLLLDIFTFLQMSFIFKPANKVRRCEETFSSRRV